MATTPTKIFFIVRLEPRSEAMTDDNRLPSDCGARATRDQQCVCHNNVATALIALNRI
jgi:hypothetical protein